VIRSIVSPSPACEDVLLNLVFSLVVLVYSHTSRMYTQIQYVSHPFALNLTIPHVSGKPIVPPPNPVSRALPTSLEWGLDCDVSGCLPIGAFFAPTDTVSRCPFIRWTGVSGLFSGI